MPGNSIDELLAKTDKLTAIDDDGWEINEDGGSELGKFCAMGRLCSNRSMNRYLIKTILGRMWGLSERSWGVEIKHSVKNFIFLVFSFKSTQDLNQILLKSPWFLNHDTLILDRMTEIPTNWEKTLSRIQLSDRILSVPPRAITQKNLTRLAGLVGEVIEVQQADVAKISSKGFFTFKVWYDRLPFMCFNCGCIGHEMRVYREPIRRVETENGENWLKFYYGVCETDSCETPILLNKTVGAGCDSGSFNGNPSRPIPAGTPRDVGTDNGIVSSPKIGDSGSVCMDDSIGDLSSKQKSSICPHSNSLSNFPADCSLASLALHEVPIIYESNVIPGEGKNKRRKSNSARLNNIGSAILGLVFANDESVASGYKLRFSDPQVAECSDKSILKKWWNFIWSSKLTRKIKNFIWRLFHHWIPVRTELTKRGMALNLYCDQCNAFVEDICHALWYCPKTQAIWKHFGFLHLFPSNIGKAPDFLFIMKDRCSKETFILFLGVTWLI
ncbi:hypothetical protein F8388_018884 [Cannabis sativa]|uniref:Reverse transcriptase zinc-binding domain-containing protein n=1 Tax=Cannabis sativa TaxID=3483 RepID=A0A7J6FZS3_CANSA|nr:hypothetical protein F8388_018884 [Cannabis sativa]